MSKLYGCQGAFEIYDLDDTKDDLRRKNFVVLGFDVENIFWDVILKGFEAHVCMRIIDQRMKKSEKVVFWGGNGVCWSLLISWNF